MTLSEKEILENKALLKPVPPKDRVLLLPHCLRRSAHCKATYQRELGMQCQKCDPECPINRILEVAETRGLNGICVAPGGSIAVEFLKRHKPMGILAVACPKELIMGVEAVGTMSDNGWEPALVTIGLLKDGCVDTEVDVDLVIDFLNL